MPNDTIFHKTTKGQQAIDTRNIKLAMTMRRALIIVDGKASVDDLQQKAPMYDNLEDMLNTLVNQGLIIANTEAVNESIFEPEATKPTPTVEVIILESPVAPQTQPDSVAATKARLTRLLKDEFSFHKKASVQKAVKKLIADLEDANDNIEALSKAWNKCIKITKLTIDVKMAELLKSSGERLFSQLTL